MANEQLMESSKVFYVGNLSIRIYVSFLEAQWKKDWRC